MKAYSEKMKKFLYKKFRLSPRQIGFDSFKRLLKILSRTAISDPKNKFRLVHSNLIIIRFTFLTVMGSVVSNEDDMRGQQEDNPKNVIINFDINLKIKSSMSQIQNCTFLKKVSLIEIR